MNITDRDGLWRLEHGAITNLKTNERRLLQHTPSANAIAYMNYKVYLLKCQQAFTTGTWPTITDNWH